MRRLAQSAAEASNEVKALIEQSGTEVGEGSKLVAQAAEKLTAMLDAVRQNSELMEGIARENREQASSIDEVNSAVRQMDEMTQHNAALVEEINAAIEQTEAQATELDRIVEVFTLDEHDHHHHGSVQSPSTASQEAPKSGVKQLQEKIAGAAKSYLSRGNAAVDADSDWSEF